ncbi:MAG: pitrilysin family protein [Cyanobacteria bacterium P01_D01_bin.105]
MTHQTLSTPNIVRLANGLTVVHQQMPTAAVVVDVWVRAGAKLEPNEWSGMAHFLEHMVFKGTHRIQPGEFDWAIESQGGSTNAATSHDYAHFFITVAADALPQTLPYLANLLLYASIPADEFEGERNVVLEEIRQAYDDPDWVGYQALCELLHGEHPYGRAVLGTPEILAERSPEEMRRFHQAHYQPENMTIAIAGGISQDHALALIQESFSHFPSPIWCPAASLQGAISWAEMPGHQTSQHQVLKLPNLEQDRLTMAWLGPGIDDIETASGLDLLAVLLGGGRTSRLVQTLREEQQLVQEVNSSFSMQQACSVLSLSMWLENDAIEQVENLVCSSLQALHTQSIDPVEFTRCQRLLLNDYAFSTETPGQVAGLYGYYATIATPKLANTYPQHLQNHTPASLRQLAQQYLNPERYTAVELHAAQH